MKTRGTSVDKILTDKFVTIFHRFESIISIILIFIIALIILIEVVIIVSDSYKMFFSKISDTGSILNDDFNELFGEIMILLITLEFMNSIVKVIKSGDLKILVRNVTLITGLALCRKLIIIDYSNQEPLLIFSLGFILMALGVFYFLIRFDRQTGWLTASRKARQTIEK